MSHNAWKGRDLRSTREAPGSAEITHQDCTGTGNLVAAVWAVSTARGAICAFFHKVGYARSASRKRLWRVRRAQRSRRRSGRMRSQSRSVVTRCAMLADRSRSELRHANWMLANDLRLAMSTALAASFLQFPDFSIILNGGNGRVFP